MFAGFSASLQSKLSLPCIIFLGYQRLLFGPSDATLQPLPRQKIPQDWLSTSACIMQQLFSGMSPCRLANLIRVRSRILPTRLTTASGVIRHFRPKASSKNDRTVVTKDGRLPQNGGIPSPKEKNWKICVSSRTVSGRLPNDSLLCGQHHVTLGYLNSCLRH